MSDGLSENLSKIADSLARLAGAAERYVRNTYPPPHPEAPVQVVPLGERSVPSGEQNMDIEQFALRLSQHPTADVARRVVTLTIPEEITVPDGLPRVQTRVVEGSAAADTDGDLTAERDIATSGAFEVPQDATFETSVVAVDDSENESTPTVQTFTAEDRTAPAPDGGVSVLALGERTA